MARRRNDPGEQMQDQAHGLLQEWANGPYESLQDAAKAEHVQGDVAELSAPEVYAHLHARWDRLDRAVRQVHRMNRDLGSALYEHYGEGFGAHRCADRACLSLRTWKDRLKTARAAFLAAYQMSCQAPSDTARARAEGA